MCKQTDISAGVPPIGVKVWTTIELSSGQSFSPFGCDIFSGHQTRDQKIERGRFWASKKQFDGEYLENGKRERYMSIIKSLTSARRELSKNIG